MQDGVYIFEISEGENWGYPRTSKILRMWWNFMQAIERTFDGFITEAAVYFRFHKG